MRFRYLTTIVLSIVMLVLPLATFAQSDGTADALHPRQTNEQIEKTLASFRKLDDHPLFEMEFHGDYNAGTPSVSAIAPNSQRSQWACSIFVSYGKEGRAIYGRNFDWQNNPALVLHTHPSDGYASVSMVDISYLGFSRVDKKFDTVEGRRSLLTAPMLPFDGMNETGLTVGMAAVSPTELPNDPKKPTAGSLQIIRLILDHAATVDEALALFEQYNISSSGGPNIHYLIADAEGHSALVELKDKKTNVIRGKDHWQSATNFYQTGQDDPLAQCPRFKTIDTTMNKHAAGLDIDQTFDLLKNVAQGNTRWSVVYDMKAKSAQISMGRHFDKRISIDPIAPSSPSADASELLEEIDAYARKVQTDWNVPGMAIAIVKDGEVIFNRGYGVRELQSQRSVDADTLFAIASNSKAFTTASLAILVDEGLLKWDDSVTKFLPRFKMPSPFVTREMTVRDLVCHRSGMATFSGDLLWYDTTYTPDEIIDRIQHLKPVSSFRSQYGYQNLMFISAGRIIEKISGKTWAEFVQTRILDPLDMERSTTSVDELADNFALPHNESGGNGLRVLPLGNVDNSWGACGLNCSVNDLAKWMIFQLNHGKVGEKQLISRRQIWEMWQPRTVMQISEAAAKRNPTRHFSAYGLGFALSDFHGAKIVSHGGGLDGMISQLAFVPEKNLGVVVLTNSESSASRYLRERVLECFLGAETRIDQSGKAIAAKTKRDLATIKAQEKIDAARVPNTTPTLSLESYAGEYESQLYGQVTIEMQDGQLVLKMIPAPNFIADLEHWQHNTFEIKWRDSVKYNFPRGFVNFTIDASGNPEKLIIDQPNNDFWFYELDLLRVK